MKKTGATSVLREALTRFEDLFARASRLDIREPSAMTLSTVDERGRPSARTVLLKGFDERGFVFYTNIRSRKGSQLSRNPHAALTFLWQELLEQVQIEGRVEPVDPEEADRYWASRPRESQLGAWASRQSETLSAREELEQEFARVERRYVDRDVPRPDFWSGLRVVPCRIEFWCSRPNRLHERVLYEESGGEWKVRLLFP